jgi:hypothetical protein
MHFKHAIVTPCSVSRTSIRAHCEEGEFAMNRISRRLSAMGAAALAAVVLASAPTLAYAGHNPYPPGWNTPTTPSGLILYQFVPGGERYHVVKPATAQSASPTEMQSQ